jgi:hypothetical protein
MTGTLALAVGVLAQQTPRDTGPDFGKASPFGLLVIVLLLIATGVLVWSMNRHLRKVPKSFHDEDGEAGAAVGDDDGATNDRDVPSPDKPGEPDG